MCWTELCRFCWSIVEINATWLTRWLTKCTREACCVPAPWVLLGYCRIKQFIELTLLGSYHTSLSTIPLSAPFLRFTLLDMHERQPLSRSLLHHLQPLRRTKSVAHGRRSTPFLYFTPLSVDGRQPLSCSPTSSMHKSAVHSWPCYGYTVSSLDSVSVYRESDLLCCWSRIPQTQLQYCFLSVDENEFSSFGVCGLLCHTQNFLFWVVHEKY
jgi:hypothetical protein